MAKTKLPEPLSSFILPQSGFGRQDAIDWVESELESARATFAKTGEGQGRVGRMMRHLARLSDPETGEAYAATVAEERAHTITVAPFVTCDEVAAGINEALRRR